MKKKVLVVDDSEIVLAKASECLEEAGFEVSTALSALEADMYIFAEQQPDLIILDVMLPMLDGDKKARMLKESSRTASIPVLLLSSKTEEELRYLVRESGADGFIRKPFDPGYLIKKIKEMLGES